MRLNVERAHEKSGTDTDEPIALLKDDSPADRELFIRAIINHLGAWLFAIGSLGWVANFLLVGTFLFAGSNVFCFTVTGIWWALASHRTFKKNLQSRRWDFDVERPHIEASAGAYGYNQANVASEVLQAFQVLTYMEIMAAFWQVSGAIAFTVGCFLSLWPEYLFETNMLYLAGSSFFILQGLISQVMCGSIWGPLLPLWPRRLMLPRKAYRNIEDSHPFAKMLPSCCIRGRICIHRCVPGAFLNTLGSFCFVVGSLLLFYESLAYYGGWGYEIGSILFVIASWADLIGFSDALLLKRWMGKEDQRLLR